MKLFKNRLGASPSKIAQSTIVFCTIGLLAALFLGGSAAAAPTAVPLGTTGTFAVLAGSGIANTGPTTLNGDLGTFPTATISGAGSLTVTGTNHAGDAVSQGAKTDLVTAYGSAAGEGPTTPIVADLAGQTLTPGIYNSASSIGLSGALTLDGGGDPNAVFVFQAGSTPTTGSASQVKLINGAQSCNIFWQVGSSATLGTASSFRGTILALTDITVTTGVSIDGRVLARNGAVTLDTDTITTPSCATPPAADDSATDTTSPTPTTSTTTTAATTTTASPTPTVTPAVLVNASTAKATSVTAAKVAVAAAAKAKSAKTAAATSARAAKSAAARSLAVKSAANKAAAANAAATAKTKAARANTALIAAKNAALHAQAAKSAAAHAASAARYARARLAAKKKLIATRKKTAATSSRTHVGHARPAIRHVGITG